MDLKFISTVRQYHPPVPVSHSTPVQHPRPIPGVPHYYASLIFFYLPLRFSIFICVLSTYFYTLKQ
jgi:hypothetical protein